MNDWVPIAALLLTAIVFVANQLTLRRKTDEGYTRSLETRIASLEGDLKDSIHARERLVEENGRLERENRDLLRELFIKDIQVKKAHGGGG